MKNRKNMPISVFDIVREMKIGWNLGNSLESPAPDKLNPVLEDYETSWGNPVTTKEMIKEVINAGFNVIRIPVTWGKLIRKGPEYIIEPEWMDRVQNVVDYAYEEGIYVIINIHHEDQWLYIGNKMVEEKAIQIMERIWTQIAERFKSYDHHLLFETMNETRLIGTADEWTSGTSEARKIINEYNKVAVRTIRKTGYRNSDRPVIIKTIGARYNVDAICDIEIPENERNIMLSIHIYEPYFFCMVPNRDYDWGTQADKEALSTIIQSAAEAARKKGLPLIIGEFGTINKDNEEARIKYTAYFVKQARKNGIACILWDNNIPKDEFSYSIFDREKLLWRHPKILKAALDNS